MQNLKINSIISQLSISLSIFPYKISSSGHRIISFENFKVNYEPFYYEDFRSNDPKNRDSCVLLNISGTLFGKIRSIN